MYNLSITFENIDQLSEFIKLIQEQKPVKKEKKKPVMKSVGNPQNNFTYVQKNIILNIQIYHIKNV